MKVALVFLPFLLLLLPVSMMPADSDNWMSADLEALKQKVSSLERENKAQKVAFSASLLAEGSGSIGPYATFVGLVFRHVITNVGDAYNSHTGIFTAPVAGAYRFEWYIGVQSKKQTAVALVKNNQRVFTALEGEEDGSSTSFSSASNAATLLLKAGDVVFVRLWPKYVVFDNENHLCTFSGHLLFPM
ncbi:caprin-2 [Fundulus heteroclitus]|uniref:caprin-2 n=1 Tax=Fundulus heteroclitus TaxID=8078 RepID=UPI00165BBCD3|nr:caprin-2 [Fundulus heteroclitus]